MRDTARLVRKLGSWADVHRIRRPVTPDGAREFHLAYVRSGPRTDRPVLLVPGGPGVASLLPYRALRAAAVTRGLDVVMVEHRGVGLSRQDVEGVGLPPESLTVDHVVADLAAVLDDCGVEQAVVYGSSYGTYLAQGLGVAADSGSAAGAPPGRSWAPHLEPPGRPGRTELTAVHRYLVEFDLVGVIAFRELGYAPSPDGPLDVNLSFLEAAPRYPAFAGEPYNLPAELPCT